METTIKKIEDMSLNAWPSHKMELYDGYGEFVDYALDTHRTLQQNLTRFFVEWFAKAEKGSAFLKRAKMVYSRYSLPYI